MQRRRDHLHAYQFATGRLASSLVTGAPGTGEAPMRRSGLGAMFGVTAAALLVGVSAVYGLLKPVRPAEQPREGTLIVEQQTGNRYLYIGGQLHPTVNYASALLAVGSGAPVQQLPRASLADVPRGMPIGIPGAPDDVAQPSALLTGAWADCLRPGKGEALDFAPATAQRVAGGVRVLVAGPDGTRYVLWDGTKYKIGDRSALIALGMDTQQPVKAPSAWLDGLPDGTPLAPAPVAGAGGGGRTVAGSSASVGRLFRTEAGGADHYYVLESDGLAPLTATEAALLAAAPGGRPPSQVSPTDIAAVQASGDTTLMHRIPDVLNGTDATADHGSALCLLHSADGRRTVVVRETGRAATSGDGVLVPPEHAVLAVPPRTSAQLATPVPYLVTDRGLKYQLADQAAEALGYGGLTPRTLSAATLDQIPAGPRLTRPGALAAVPETR
ncbi:type VII secretion protein EccB [Streptomyces sp. NPDC047022]|uniref:type VII secretion protein EccB n=1 Tax=Streptomyces sp. NPDC047022 TaxID=3155737 RepID=UPI00340D441B